MNGMLNLDKQQLEFQCPYCKFWNPFFYKQARLRDVVICRGCKNSVRLDDDMNTCRKARRSLNRALADLENTLKGLSTKITIKF